jgi:hypothetical protein
VISVFNLDKTPEMRAENIVKSLQGLRPHKTFRKVIRNYVWDNIYHDKLLPLLEHVIGSKMDSIRCMQERFCLVAFKIIGADWSWS